MICTCREISRVLQHVERTPAEKSAINVFLGRGRKKWKKKRGRGGAKKGVEWEHGKHTTGKMGKYARSMRVLASVRVCNELCVHAYLNVTRAHAHVLALLHLYVCLHARAFGNFNFARVIAHSHTCNRANVGMTD